MYYYADYDFVYTPVKQSTALSLFSKLFACVKQNKCYASMSMSYAFCLFYRTFPNKRDNGWCMSESLAYYPVVQGFIRCVASCSRTTDAIPNQSDSFLCVKLLANGRVQVTSALKRPFNEHIVCLSFYDNFYLEFIFTKLEDVEQLEKYCKILVGYNKR